MGKAKTKPRKRSTSGKTSASKVPTLPAELRYLGFLVQEWEKLARKNLVAPDEAAPKKTQVLGKTLDILGDEPGLRLEFGVWQGNSIRLCAERFPDQRWFGFDSFEGFPDDGRVDWQKPFKVIDVPDTPKNVTLVQGYFSDTLEPFLKETPGEVAFINVDCDIYSSTADVFQALEKQKRLRAGLVIHFDELINYADYMWNESLALFEMLERTGFGVEWLCYDQHLRRPEESAALFHSGQHPTWMDDMRSGHWMQASCALNRNGIDYGPIGDKAYVEKLEWMLAGMHLQEKRRIKALDARNQRLREMDEERERRFVERKRLEKQRQKDNLERNRREKEEERNR